MNDPLASALSRALAALGPEPEPSTLAGWLADALAGAWLPERSALVWAFRSGLGAAARRGEVGEAELRARLEAGGHGEVAPAVVIALTSGLRSAERTSRWREGARAVGAKDRVAILAAERSADGRVRRLGVILPDPRGSRYLEGSRAEAPRLLEALGEMALVGADLPALLADLESLGLRSRTLADLHETAAWLADCGQLTPAGGLGLDALAAAVGLPAPVDLRNRTAAAAAIWLTLLRPAIPA